MLQISPILAFDDNYIWCIENNQNAYVVDPGDASPVMQYLEEKQLSLKGILVTHHHPDHIGGIKALMQWQAANKQPELHIVTPDTERYVFATQKVNDGDVVELKDLTTSLKVMQVPGHTLDHIAYVNDSALFSGDTLFSGGCGRLFEGDAKQMQSNFARFNALSDDIKVYCAHEYTAANMAFAKAVWPQNAAIDDYLDWVASQRQQEIPTIPSNIALEKKINPFMNAHSNELKKNVEQHFNNSYTSPTDVFAALRQWKDTF
ncbi:hydroxyacylglutathione hydrolase [Alteromonas sp. a30]|uniref:hydroxyacylglutathione hydrolase n=1 Tax=Alteromonas sp. a30 TaxID=2730917 RepID=UPI00227FF1E3|nr:hydroxyacylglutathione hydrolase [Alteromonas sp. a30]MCY7297008.1 hydroxyacylglutathione hydrolase [Alteromonas sp. a30]